MTEIKEAAKKHVTDQVYEEWFETLSPAQDKALLNLFHKTYEAGANFMLEELNKGVESVVCPKCKSDNLEYPDAQNCEKSTRCCNCGNAFSYEEEQHNLLIFANAKIAKLTEALKFSNRALTKNAEYFCAIAIGEYNENRRTAPLMDYEELIKNMSIEAALKNHEALKSCEQYDEQKLDGL